MISGFIKDYSFLSNFYFTPVEFEGETYITSESAFQAAKTLDPEIRKQFTQMAPGPAKRKGRTLELRADWEAVKEDVMYRILKAKFTPDYMKQLLLETGDEYLEEGNTWHDNIWGNCSCPKCRDIPGANRLGKLLMRVRDEAKT